MGLCNDQGEWKLNKIESGKPYSVWETHAFNTPIYQVNDRFGTVALSNWMDGKRTGAVFTTEAIANELCALANQGLIERE